jgi:UDP-N-acetylmuramoyl-L-alanyl-D-glutamate--2,6-diaminopimelate ligase
MVVRGAAARGLAGTIQPGPGGEVRVPVESRLVGEFNIANTLTAVGLGLALGLDLAGMVKAIKDFPGVPGRMETIDCGQAFAVLVDYAHTPDSVENVLRTARTITQGRLIAVLGCGGDRDRSKRPLMGRAAELLADVVVITSDNPRSEDPEAIISDILAGLDAPRKAAVQPDRRLAIQYAIQIALPGDVVMILGKGHETGQEFADQVVPFDDREVAREILQVVNGGML